MTKSKGREYFESGSSSKSPVAYVDSYGNPPKTSKKHGKESVYERSPKLGSSTTEATVHTKSKPKISGLEYRKDYIRNMDPNIVAPELDANGIPVNATSTNVSNLDLLKRHYNSLERLMETRIFREKADDPTKKVIYDIKNILADLILMVETRQTDQQFINLFKEARLFSGDISNDDELKVLLEDWKTTFIKLATGSESKGILRSTSKVVSDLKGSESIFRFLSEGSKFLQMIVLDKNSQFLDEQREVVFDQFYKVFRVLSGNPAWSDFVLNSKTLGSQVRETSAIESKNASTKIDTIKGNQHFNSMTDKLKILIQSFIKNKDVADVDMVFKYGGQSIDELQKNKGYSVFMEDFRNLTIELMENPDLIEDPAFRKAMRDLYAKAEQLITETKQSPALQKFAAESGRLKEGIATDELNSRLWTHFRSLLADLNTHTAAGNMRLAGQLKMLLVPFLLEEFRTITIPPQMGLTPDRNLGYRIGAINLSSIELLPENIHFEISHKTNADPYTLSIIDPDTIVWVELTAIRARIDSLTWEYEKFNFPRLKDSGLADIFLDGRGARVGVEIRLLKDGLQRKTQVLDSYCILDSFKVKLYHCKHSFIYKIFTSLLKNRIKFEIEKAVAQQVAKIIAETDYKMVGKYQVAKQNRLRFQSKMNSRVSEIKGKMKKNKKNKDAKEELKKKTNQFYKAVVGDKNSRPAQSSSEQYISGQPISTTTTTTRTESMVIPENTNTQYVSETTQKVTENNNEKVIQTQEQTTTVVGTSTN
ncbi:hypothetical protein DICPUDRAFT_49657 [Dictyostelium purpureum]|uniref:HAM1-like N-terminal domain-containing protein n=1 Tax=Dictyostelium purpureum TaxID=5786 RepID=F0ZUQ8_DICPU|nr:uncharacterized protein DICPUDRAFT_49657 [Dictyostelium purpureum]EGC32309.1 hypothetical protein DICPUDRAFT_49657 [Dictyostelium purpureum]|eukprot:XP_003291151.1 hypothetical protein DICPUDRAFT_49657 [Dictyostelium purpureum]